MNLSAAALALHLCSASSLSGIASADFNGLRHPSRSRRQSTNRHLQGDACAGLKNKQCNDGCEWSKGNCVPKATSPTPPPPTPTAPTPPPPTPTAPTPPPPTPTAPTPPTGPATYVPGDLTVPCDDGKLLLSTGMECRLLTTAGTKVEFADGSLSSADMHGKADGAGVIPHPTDGGWYYASNSEESKGKTKGGVGVLRFASNGDLIDYNMPLTGTARNCGGGVTPWRTWVSCEEDGSQGQCHEVDPHTGYTQQTRVVAQGGQYESFAYDDQDPDVVARFFTTEDSSTGALTRYTPHTQAFNTGDNFDILNTANGVHEYLVLNDNTNPKTFSWSPNLADGEDSASALFPNSEGIDVHDRILNFVSKSREELFTLNLADQTWVKSSTLSGAFNLQPDQLGRIIDEGEILYFAEDGGGDCDIHGRDSTGKYFTIVKGPGYSTETTGLAFSPDGMIFYAAFQSESNIYEFKRTDGLPFSGTVAEIKYHTN